MSSYLESIPNELFIQIVDATDVRCLALTNHAMIDRCETWYLSSITNDYEFCKSSDLSKYRYINTCTFNLECYHFTFNFIANQNNLNIFKRIWESSKKDSHSITLLSMVACKQILAQLNSTDDTIYKFDIINYMFDLAIDNRIIMNLLAAAVAATNTNESGNDHLDYYSIQWLLDANVNLLFIIYGGYKILTIYDNELYIKHSTYQLLNEFKYSITDKMIDEFISDSYIIANLTNFMIKLHHAKLTILDYVMTYNQTQDYNEVQRLTLYLFTTIRTKLACIHLSKSV